MKATMQYAWLTIKHKWFVFLAGIRIGCPMWRLITHDLSKFGRSELMHYGRQFFGKANDPYGFTVCWLHHQHVNLHHWEAWIPITGHNRGGYGDMEPLPMPIEYIYEMVADWMGASRAYEGKWPDASWPWLHSNWNRIKIHEKTRGHLSRLLKWKLGIDVQAIEEVHYGYPASALPALEAKWRKHSENPCYPGNEVEHRDCDAKTARNARRREETRRKRDE